MLKWSFIFLIISLIAAAFGFSGIGADAAEIAKILFFIFLRDLPRHVGSWD